MKFILLRLLLIAMTACEEQSPKPQAAMPQVTERPAPMTGDLSIEAGIVYNVGGPQPSLAQPFTCSTPTLNL